MIRILAVFALVTAPIPAFAQEAPRLSLEQRMLLRCSAAFALVARGQADGDASVGVYPPMAERGREFFVRASAQVMEEAALDRAQISAALTAEAQDISDNDTLDEVMSVCLPMLPLE